MIPINVQLSQNIWIFQAEGEPAVLVAGDPARENMRKVRQDGGICYHVNVLHAMVSTYIRKLSLCHTGHMNTYQ